MSMVPPGTGAFAHAPAGLAKARMVRPTSIGEACEMLAQERAVLLAGGTDWIVDRHLMSVERATDVACVVDLTGIRELAQVRVAGDRLILGGGVTYWALRTDARMTSAIPMLAVMAKDVGAVQIQTRGTLGGNIASASPAADGVPALMALDAVVTLRSLEKTRQIPLDAFFTGYRKTVMTPGEIITELNIAIPSAQSKVAWRKVGTRLAQAISKVALASVLEIDQGIVKRARFGMASVAPTTSPLAHVRRAIEGQALASIDRPAVARALAEDITPIDDVRSTGAYRMHVAEALVWNAISAAG